MVTSAGCDAEIAWLVIVGVEGVHADVNLRRRRGGCNGGNDVGGRSLRSNKLG